MTEEEIKQNLGKGKDLRNQKFNKLTPLYPLKERSKDRGIIWHCKCDCGKEINVKSSNLKSYNTTSCGCYQKEQVSKVKMKNLIGQKFGRLTVIELTKQRIDNKIIWKCQCECGNIVYAISSNLLDGHTKSCGCLKSSGEEKIIQILKENNIKFETQKTFETCRFEDTNALAKFDFYLSDYNILIEYDGKQHYLSNGTGYYTQNKIYTIQQHDNFKNQWCKDNNIKLIRIPYTHYDDISIKDLLLNSSFLI